MANATPGLVTWLEFADRIGPALGSEVELFPQPASNRVTPAMKVATKRRALVSALRMHECRVGRAGDGNTVRVGNDSMAASFLLLSAQGGITLRLSIGFPHSDGQVINRHGHLGENLFCAARRRAVGLGQLLRKREVSVGRVK